jgi:hypothetical protein
MPITLPGMASLDAMLYEVRRELAMRASVYPRIIASKKMRQEDGDLQIARLREVLAVLEMLRTERGKHDNEPNR